jgi:hypothetical protein
MRYSNNFGPVKLPNLRAASHLLRELLSLRLDVLDSASLVRDILMS